MVINKASLIMIEGNQPPNASTVANLALLLSSAEITQMPKILGPKVKVVATKAVAIKAVVVAMAGIMGRPIVGPCYRCP